MDLARKAHDWGKRRLTERLLHLYGGIQTCPWCSQTVQWGGAWSIVAWDRDPFLDVITCGPCGGTSLWRFELGMIYIGPLSPPEPKHKPVEFYDIENACLRGAE